MLKIQSGERVIIIDPYGPQTGLPPLRPRADILILTNPKDPNMSHSTSIQGEPMIIATPGEYSLGTTGIYAVPWQSDDGSERSIIRITEEDMSLVATGALNRMPVASELQELEKVDIDILLVPVGGGSALTAKQAVELITTIEPKTVIPTHFHLPKDKEKLDDIKVFAKEMGISNPKPEKKVILKANRLSKEDLETIILVP